MYPRQKQKTMAMQQSTKLVRVFSSKTKTNCYATEYQVGVCGYATEYQHNHIHKKHSGSDNGVAGVENHELSTKLGMQLSTQLQLSQKKNGKKWLCN